jgi:hypothetical protein
MVKEGEVEEDEQEQEDQLKRKVVDKLSKRLLEDGYCYYYGQVFHGWTEK